MPKRVRYAGGYPARKKGRRGVAAATRRYKKRTGRATGRRFGPGFQRTIGYYGRFGRSAGKNQEQNFLDVTITDAAVATGGTVQSNIQLVVQGDGQSQRNGRKINIRKVQARWDITLPTTATAADTSDVVRLLLVHDKSTNGVELTPGNVNSGVLVLDDYLAFNNLINTGRFVVLMDRFYELKSQAGSGRGTTDTLSYGEDVICDSFFKEMDLSVQYDTSASTGVISTIRTNSLHWVTFSKAGLCALNMKSRIRFDD